MLLCSSNATPAHAMLQKVYHIQRYTTLSPPSARKKPAQSTWSLDPKSWSLLDIDGKGRQDAAIEKPNPSWGWWACGKLEFVHIRNKRLKGGLLSQKTVGFNILADSSKLPHKGVLTLFQHFNKDFMTAFYWFFGSMKKKNFNFCFVFLFFIFLSF